MSKICPMPPWLRRVAAAGFLFFLVKGLVWLGVIAAVALGIVKS